MEWFYANESDQQVSFQEENFQGLVEAGSIKEGTLVWNETMSDWKPCSDVRPDLFGIAASSSPDNSIPAYTTQPTVDQPTTAQPAVPPSAPPTPSQNDGLAIASLVCGICGFVCYPIGLFLGLAAVICGHISRKRLVERTGSTDGGGLALAGLILGYIAMTISIIIGGIYIVLMIVGATSGEFSS